MTNRELKAQIFLRYPSQAEAAADLNTTEWRLSRIIHGYNRPHAEEAKAIREKLGVDLMAPEMARAE